MDGNYKTKISGHSIFEGLATSTNGKVCIIKCHIDYKLVS